MAIDRKQLLNDLRNEVIEVSFTKVSDGTNRVMRCSLKKDLLPESYAQEESEEKQFHESNPDVIAAWDVQKGGWRSFRLDTVDYVQVVDSY